MKNAPSYEGGLDHDWFLTERFIDSNAEEEEEAEKYRKLRTALAGYYMIAVGEGSDRIVEEVFKLLSPVESVAKAEGIERRVPGIEKAASLLAAARRSGRRVDKVIAIDAVMHLTHERSKDYLSPLQELAFDISVDPTDDALAHSVWYFLDLLSK